MTNAIETLHLEYLDGKTTAVITLDDPEHANAMTPEMGDAFSYTMREIQGNREARVAIVRGAGKDFSIGGHRDMLIGLGSGKMGQAQLAEFMLGFYNRCLTCSTWRSL
jgi:enoyl-CoA hydratase/carnithine racemase